MANLFNKKKLVIALASAALGLCTMAAAGCGEKVEQINITKNNMPQQVYVLGNDLNLSDGKLTVLIDGERSEVPMNDPEVSVSGYDKNKLGEQVITVTYKEQTTVFKVTVVPRVSVAKYETFYFIGESFNSEKGELTITADNGESTFVNINDPSVTVSGFDSTAQNDALALSVTYQDGDVSYDASFNVAIYEALEVDFRAPNKKSYKSHDSALDVSGGYIALKNGDVSRYVTLTADMVSGFDISEATAANMEDPVIQELSVDYCGYEKTYEIDILFSSVSLINLRASEMGELNWTGSELPTDYEEAMGENAMQAMELYFAMQPEELALLDDGAADHVAKVAAVYGLEKWQEAFASYKDALYLSEDGVLAWDCSDFEKTKAAHQNILNKDPVLYQDAVVLGQIAEQFAELVFVEEGETTVGEILSVVYAPDMIDAFAEQLQMMISLHEALVSVPTDWDLELLKAEYSEEIHNAWVILFETKFKGLNYRSLYYLTSKWREKNDFFEILYTYYYDMGDEGMTKIKAFKDLRLPGELEPLYNYLLSARNELIYIQQGYSGESVNFMRNYEEALLQKQVVLNSNDSMIVDLYNTLEFDFLLSDGQGAYAQVTFDSLFNNFYRATNGYVQNFNAYLGIDTYEELWESFSAALKRASETEGYFESEQYAQDAQGLLAAYMSLTPKQQLGFMGLIHPYYIPAGQTGRYPTFAWENDGEGFNSQFTYFIYNYYESVLPESTHEMFTELMLASESLANLLLFGGIDNFFTHMDNYAELSSRVANRNPQELQTFQDVVGWVVLEMEAMETKFAALKTDPMASPTVETLTDEEMKDFENLLNALYEAYAMMLVYQSNGSKVALAFYAQMENVEAYSQKILASEDPRIRRAYYFDEMYMEGVLMPDGTTANFGGNMDILVYILREQYTNGLTGMSYLTVNELVYDAYQRMNVKGFLQKASYLYFNYVYMNLLPSGDENAVYFEDEELMLEIADTFRNELTDDQRYFLLVLDNSARIYHSSFVRFGKERNAKMGDVLEGLCSLEYMYVYYMKNLDAKDETGTSYKQLLLNQYDDLQYYYDSLLEDIEEEKTKPAEEQNAQVLSAIDDFMKYFGDMYNYYVEKCEALKQTEVA